jgi:hypothetical protein
MTVITVKKFKMKIKYLIASIGILALCAGLTGCEEGDKAVTGIAVSRETVTIDADALTTLIPFPLPWDAVVDGQFTWTSENRNIARVNNKGEVLGVDAGETDLVCAYGNFTTKVHVTVNSTVTLGDRIKALNAKGYWEFENTSALTAAIVGNPLIFVEDNKTITSLEGPRFDNRAIRIPQDPKNRGVTGTFVQCQHGFALKGGQEKINEYTVMWDIRLPDEAGMPESGYYSLMSARTLDNSQDQDFAIKSAGSFGIGSLGYAPDGTLVKGKWHRVVLSAKAGEFFTYYVDGKKVYDGNAEGDGAIDKRFSLLPAGVLFFSDEDGDDSTIDASAVAIWDTALTADNVAALGSVRQTISFTE